MRRVLGLAIAVLVVAAPTAGADGADHTHAPVVLRIEPHIEGLTVEARPEPAPTLVIDNDTGEVVEIEPIIGDAFLRIGPTTVEANVRSPEFFRSESPSPLGIVPPSADAGTPPQWVAIASQGTWAWFEHRISLAGFDEEWRIPITVGGEPAEIVGEWRAVDAPGQVVATIDPIDIEGLEVAILPGLAPGLYVGNDTGSMLFVDDDRGDPFLRIGPGATTRATPDGRFEVVAPTASYGWIEARIGWRGTPPDRRASRSWEIPVRLGERDLVLTGTTVWEPLADPEDGGGRGFPWLGVGGVLVAALAAVAWVVTRRDESA